MRNVIFIVIVLIIYSCEKKNTFVKNDVINLLNEEMIKKEKSKDDLISPVLYSHLPVFGLTENKFIICTKTDYLYHIYINFYKKDFIDFKDFLSNFLNHKLIIPKEKFYSKDSFFFDIDKNIEEDYNNKNFEEFYKKYCTIGNNKIYINTINYKRGINKNELFSIIYYLSINNYYIESDDYMGFYYVKNWNKITGSSE